MRQNVRVYKFHSTIIVINLPVPFALAHAQIYVWTYEWIAQYELNCIFLKVR